jgi:hypothetical protein
VFVVVVGKLNVEDLRGKTTDYEEIEAYKLVHCNKPEHILEKCSGNKKKFEKFFTHLHTFFKGRMRIL